MKRIIYTIFAAALLAVSAISCQKAEEPQNNDASPEIPKVGFISVSLTATMEELTPSNEVKSGVTPVIRLTWATEGDKVFVYDASEYLGSLDVTLKDNDARYAYLNGTIQAPSDGTEVLTCIHVKGLAEAPAVEDGKVTVSLADQNGDDSEIPFVVYGTIDYNGQSSIVDKLVNFSFATSVVNVNCIDLTMNGNTQQPIESVYVKGINTACQLSLSNTAAPSVSGTNVGEIIRKGVTGGSNKLAFLMSVPVSPSAAGRELYVIQQSNTMYSSFTSTAFAAGKFINVMYKLEPSSRVEGISLDIDCKDIYIGDEFTLTATITPEDALIKDVLWTSSNEEVATVDVNGKVTAVATGTATITATTVDGGKTASCQVQVTVGVHVESISLDVESKGIYLGDEFTLTATVAPEDATVKDINWTSSNKNVATVDGNGKVTAVATGTATITATMVDGGKTASCQVTVGIRVENVSLDFESKEIPIDTKFTLTATVTPENALTKDVLWTSSNEEVATVDGNGKVTAVAAGTATITVTTVDGGKTASCTVKVPAYLPGVFSVSDTKKVLFSQGNLTYNVSTTDWAFYDHQYDHATGYDANLISLFTWGYSEETSLSPGADTYVTVHTNKNDQLIYDKASSEGGDDWGVAYCESNSIAVGTWRTLSSAEWQHLFNARTMTNGKARYSNATSGVSIGGTTYKGVFLYPDNYNGDVVSNNSMTWEQINAAGIVFLPATSARFRSIVLSLPDECFYWSSSAEDSSFAYYVSFSTTGHSLGNLSFGRKYGCGVRLVTDVQAE